MRSQCINIDDDDQRDMPHRKAGAPAYSLSRALRRIETGKPLDGLEAETSAELARRTGKKPHGFYLPHDAQVRSLSTTTGAGGIPTKLGTIIDLLRAHLVIAQAGATILPDLRGGLFALPQRTATASAAWLTEGASPNQSSQTLGTSVPFVPRTVSAYTDASRRATASIPDLDAILADDLCRAIAVEVDRVALAGSGINSEPLGLLRNPGVGITVFGTNGGPPTRALLAAMEQTIGNANADVGPLAWVTNPNGRYKLRTTEKTASTGRYLWDDDSAGPLDLPAFVTTNLPSNLTKGSSGAVCSPLILGGWSSLIIGLWGPIDVIINPYLFSTNGVLRVSAMQDIDVNCRHLESFNQALDVTTT